MATKMKPKANSKPRQGRYKFLSHTLYTYTQKDNGLWARREAAKRKVPYSLFVDALIQAKRTGKQLKEIIQLNKKRAA